MSSSRSSALFKRLKLLDEQEFDRLIERQIRQYDPAIHSMAQMRKDMDSALSRDDFLSLFTATQNRYNKIKPPNVASLPPVPIPA